MHIAQPLGYEPSIFEVETAAENLERYTRYWSNSNRNYPSRR